MDNLERKVRWCEIWIALASAWIVFIMIAMGIKEFLG